MKINKHEMDEWAIKRKELSLISASICDECIKKNPITSTYHRECRRAQLKWQKKVLENVVIPIGNK